MLKVALHNLGCKVNSYETEAMKQLLENNGYEIVPFTDKTCILHWFRSRIIRHMRVRVFLKNCMEIH